MGSIWTCHVNIICRTMFNSCMTIVSSFVKVGTLFDGNQLIAIDLAAYKYTIGRSTAQTPMPGLVKQKTEASVTVTIIRNYLFSDFCMVLPNIPLYYLAFPKSYCRW